ncbi:MAG: iron-sulfur cluster assembly scaffold protein [Candidatus Omnitrophica bacterium]|nr:iron-sulfur cluster assembly scaffold protein [Candidatus Omnitrophota bacterium]MDD5237649.1 iron-sulfur cluster assembly scaffold protein [Candidatus Omnitrophota bacterium]
MKHNAEEGLAEYPQEVIDLINNQQYCGRINDPISSSYLKGPCGDAMEFYLVIDKDKITEIKYYTEGCHTTRACAAMAAKLASGKTIKEALSISAGEIITKLKGLPEDRLHCSILSVSTLYRAIADYLLKK